MKLQRNAFYYFAVLVFLAFIFLAITSVLHQLGANQEYPYLLKGEWLLAIIMALLMLIGTGALWSRLQISSRLDHHPQLVSLLENISAGLLVVLGVFLRLLVINTLPMEPASDYKTYYELAVLIKNGNLVEAGEGYCDYVSMFPHVFGYPAVLAWVFSVFGASVRNALIFNLIVQTVSCVLVWRIARMCCGRLCGLISLAAVCFLPSTILYSNFVASEPLFTCLLLVGIWLFALSLKSRRQDTHPWHCTILLVCTGAVLAFASFIRPMAVIFLIAAVITVLPGDKPLPALPRNDIPLGLRATNKGWKRCLIMAVVYLMVSRLFTLGVGYAVNRSLAGSTASYGYNMLVGLNLDSYGGWNQDDADYLYAALDATGSAQEAQLACRDMALQRLKVDPRALLNLFVHKFEVLMGNDDYGASWNILFMDQQGNLTPEREYLLYRMMDISDLYFMFLLLGAGVFGCLMIKRHPDPLYACVLLICGTLGLHLFVENQNRYHYHILPILGLLFGASVSSLVHMVDQGVMSRIYSRNRQEAEKNAYKTKVALEQHEADERARLRAEALHAQFDMGTALHNGNIRIIMSKGAADMAGQPYPEAAPVADDEKKQAEAPEALPASADAAAKAAPTPFDLNKHLQEGQIRVAVNEDAKPEPAAADEQKAAPTDSTDTEKIETTDAPADKPAGRKSPLFDLFKRKPKPTLASFLRDVEPASKPAAPEIEKTAEPSAEPVAEPAPAAETEATVSVSDLAAEKTAETPAPVAAPVEVDEQKAAPAESADEQKMEPAAVKPAERKSPLFDLFKRKPKPTLASFLRDIEPASEPAAQETEQSDAPSAEPVAEPAPVAETEATVTVPAPAAEETMETPAPVAAPVAADEQKAAFDEPAAEQENKPTDGKPSERKASLLSSLFKRKPKPTLASFLRDVEPVPESAAETKAETPEPAPAPVAAVGIETPEPEPAPVVEVKVETPEPEPAPVVEVKAEAPVPVPVPAPVAAVEIETPESKPIPEPVPVIAVKVEKSEPEPVPAPAPVAEVKAETPVPVPVPAPVAAVEIETPESKPIPEPVPVIAVKVEKSEPEPVPAPAPVAEVKAEAPVPVPVPAPVAAVEIETPEPKPVPVHEPVAAVTVEAPVPVPAPVIAEEQKAPPAEPAAALMPEPAVVPAAEPIARQAQKTYTVLRRKVRPVVASSTPKAEPVSAPVAPETVQSAAPKAPVTAQAAAPVAPAAAGTVAPITPETMQTAALMAPLITQTAALLATILAQNATQGIPQIPATVPAAAPVSAPMPSPMAAPVAPQAEARTPARFPGEEPDAAPDFPEGKKKTWKQSKKDAKMNDRYDGKKRKRETDEEEHKKDKKKDKKKSKKDKK